MDCEFSSSEDNTFPLFALNDMLKNYRAKAMTMAALSSPMSKEARVVMSKPQDTDVISSILCFSKFQVLQL